MGFSVNPDAVARHATYLGASGSLGSGFLGPGVGEGKVDAVGSGGAKPPPLPTNRSAYIGMTTDDRGGGGAVCAYAGAMCKRLFCVLVRAWSSCLFTDTRDVSPSLPLPLSLHDPPPHGAQREVVGSAFVRSRSGGP